MPDSLTPDSAAGSPGAASRAPTGSGSWSILTFGFALMGLAVFDYRVREYGGYFAEDAYIAFRFAEHFGLGHGFVWNLGHEPVEGFTSVLHVILLSTSVPLHLPIQLIAIVLGIVPAILLGGLVLALVRGATGKLVPITGTVLAVFYIDSRLAIHAIAGLETVLYMWLLLMCLAISWIFLQNPSRLNAAALALTNTICLLGRPDAAPYIVGQALVLFVMAVRTRKASGSSVLLGRTTLSYALLFGIGSAYLAWKLAYYGYIFPNSYYMKSGSFTVLYGQDSVLRFVKSLRYLLLASLPALVFVDFRRLIAWLKQPYSIGFLGLLLVPSFMFLLYYLTVIPEVNYASRFEYPTYIFFAIALATLISAGWSASAGRTATWTSGRPSRVSPRILLVAYAISTAAILGWTVRVTHVDFPWFRIVEQRYYRPIGEALRTTALGPEATIVFSSAGVVPFVSRLDHIDPVGLTDNALSGRHPITALERERYIWGQDPDVYIGPEPPAMGGFGSYDEDPVVQSAYVQDVLLFEDRFRLSGAYRKTYGDLTYHERAEAIHARMRELRDRWTLLGEIAYPVPFPADYTTFAYVRTDSPHFLALEEAIAPLITVEPNQIDLGMPE